MKTEELLLDFRMTVPCLDDLYKLNIDDNIDTGDIIMVEETGGKYMLVNPIYINSSKGWSLISQTASNSMTITPPSSTTYLNDNDWTSTISSENTILNNSIAINDLESEIKMLKENMNRQLNITMLHGCRNCGAKMDVDINKPIFYCKYCGTSYAIATVQMYSTY